MQGDARVIELLNEQLTSELTAINQYFLHAKMQQNWGYTKLAAHTRAESIEEMTHAERLTDRILFLEGLPNYQKLLALRIGQTVGLDPRPGVQQRPLAGQHGQGFGGGLDGRRPGRRRLHALERDRVGLVHGRSVRAPQPLEGGDRLGIPACRRAPVDVDRRRVLRAHRLAEHREPEVDDGHPSQDLPVRRHAQRSA